MWIEIEHLTWNISQILLRPAKRRLRFIQYFLTVRAHEESNNAIKIEWTVKSRRTFPNVVMSMAICFSLQMESRSHLAGATVGAWCKWLARSTVYERRANEGAYLMTYSIGLRWSNWVAPIKVGSSKLSL